MKLRTRMLIERLVEEAVNDAFDATRYQIHHEREIRNNVSKKIFEALDAVFEFPTTVKLRKSSSSASRF